LKLTKLLLTAATLLALAVPALAGELTDYSDRSAQTCDSDEISELVTSLWENGKASKIGIRLLYVKGTPVETSRKRDELRCRVSLVTNSGTFSGIFRWVNQDGHALYGFEPGKSK
jgi:hypothetical protein